MGSRNLVLLLKIAFALLPVGYLAAVRAFLHQPVEISHIILLLIFSAVIMVFSAWLKVEPAPGHTARFNLVWPALLAAVLLGGWLSTRLESQALAWVALGALLALSVKAHAVLGGRRFFVRWWLGAGLVGGAAVLLAVLFNQVWIRFSEEEFFTAVQAVLLFGFWLSLAAAYAVLRPALPLPTGPWLGMNPRIILAAGLLLAAAAGLGVVKSYQASFYAPAAQLSPGISADSPFLCGTVETPGEESPGGTAFFAEYVRRVAANPNLSAPEQGFLFLATGDAQWAAAFHTSLLDEAARSLFTAPANSVKFDQYLAALRVYAYARVRERQPGLFSPDEQARIADWFHAVNRRAMTVEWVDFMYGLAFSARPEGPYENQENGAGLIALLEAENLADPALSQRNLDYLARNQRGWEARFHNTDDSLIYQAEWITNAYFQRLYTGQAPAQNVRNSFEWLLLQMLPDGRAPQYNTPGGYELTGALYFGASLLRDGRFLWLANQSLNAQGNTQFIIHPQLGAAQAIDLTGAAPTQGSCLIYGDSGLPTQAGPLAPDKIVFRQGWSPGDMYLLLNLRFEGWHRYKGTNTVTLIDQGGTLVDEQISGEAFSWLPVGRSLFRDKRIPRENLNGFQIPRQGLDAVLVQLLGYGSSWAQDPPFTAQVDGFSTSKKMDVSQTSLVGWHGWTQTRKIFFAHSGITVILDDAQGPPDQTSAVSWNVAAGEQTAPGHIWLTGGSAPVEMILMGQEQGTITLTAPSDAEGQASRKILYTAPVGGHLRLATVFLSGEWAGAAVQLSGIGASQLLDIRKPGSSFQIDLNEPVR